MKIKKSKQLQIEEDNRIENHLIISEGLVKGTPYFKKRFKKIKESLK
jgi:hypothetical protein